MSTVKKVALLHIENRRLLCVRTKGMQVFYNVGGKPEPGETDAETLLRECWEEIGVRINPDTMGFAGLFTGAMPPDSLAKNVEIYAYFANFAGVPTPQNEIEELGWLNSVDAPKMPETGGEILRYLVARGLID